MLREIFVHLLPESCREEALRGGVAVVIDVLRATTTIVHALAAGASAVIPCGEIDEARRLAADYPVGSVLLGGERHGTRIEGFDLDNSPARYTADAVHGKTLVFTTTNGTRALLRAVGARRVLVAAFANLRSVVTVLLAETGPVHIVCAGTDGRITLEDALCAGAIVSGLVQTGEFSRPFSDETVLAATLFEMSGGNAESRLETLRISRGGLNLIKLGMETDIDIASRQNTFDIVPELFQDPWRIQPTTANPPIK